MADAPPRLTTFGADEWPDRPDRTDTHQALPPVLLSLEVGAGYVRGVALGENPLRIIRFAEADLGVDRAGAIIEVCDVIGDVQDFGAVTVAAALTGGTVGPVAGVADAAHARAASSGRAIRWSSTAEHGVMVNADAVDDLEAVLVEAGVRPLRIELTEAAAERALAKRVRPGARLRLHSCEIPVSLLNRYPDLSETDLAGAVGTALSHLRGDTGGDLRRSAANTAVPWHPRPGGGDSLQAYRADDPAGMAPGLLVYVAIALALLLGFLLALVIF